MEITVSRELPEAARQIRRKSLWRNRAFLMR